MKYFLGIVAAVVAGIAFNVGVLIQKAGVDKAPKDGRLMRSLLRSPLWIFGVALQLVLGSPLYVLSVGLIGPAIVPGLMSIGLVVLALGAVFVRKERIAPRESAGIALVVLAVAGFGLSRLSIDLSSFSTRDPGLLARAAVFAAALVAVALACARVARAASSRTASSKTASSRTDAAAAGAQRPGVSERAAAFHAVRAGAWYNVGNLALGFVTAGLERFGRGVVDVVEIIVFVAAAGLTVGGNMFGLAATQHALAHGRAAVSIPLQNGVTQILPVLVFFLVYRLSPLFPGSIAFLGSAVVLLVAGITLLVRKLA